MDLTVILLAGGTMLVLAVAAGQSLGWANKVFHVVIDPRIDAVHAALPGTNCGACGFPGCMACAEAIAAGKAPPNKCPVGGENTGKAVAKIVGVELKPTWPYRPVVHCRASYGDRLQRGDYRGEPTCTAANLISGVQGCTYGCLGLSDCVTACEFDAIHMVDGLAVVDYDACVGCAACAKACPRNIITMVPFKTERMLVVACSNKDIAREVKAVCKVGCIGCTACSKVSQLFKVSVKIPVIDYDAYDPEKMDAALIAVRKCPAKSLTFVGKPSPTDVAKVAHEKAADLVEVDFKTTVDKTEWHG